MEIAVKINNLSVSLGRKVKALKNVNLELPTGKTIGVIGPSGAGKTTLITAIVGRLKISDDSVMVFGQMAGSPELRTKVTYMTQELSVYSDLTVQENVSYFATMFGQSKTESHKMVSQVLDTVDLTNKASSLVANLSGGQKQRVSLAIALIGSPRLIVLDEPTVGLDPVLREKLWQLFNKLASQGTTLIISSHSMDEASRCDDLVLIRDGEVLAHGSPKDFLESTQTDSVESGFLKLVGNKE
jgi:ABC-2 type transport system ATP-binding protein